MTGKEEIFLGHFARPFGIKGDLKLVPSQDFWEEVLASKKLICRMSDNGSAEAKPIELKQFRRQNKFYVLTAEGISDRTTAESLVGGKLFVTTDALDVDLPDAALPFQIVGCRVESEDGESLGEVTNVLFTPSHDVYEVTGDRGAFLVPAVPEYVIAMDEDEKKIILRPIPGLIDDVD